ncbi:uncharacterized protein LOC106720026 [Papilio machaon]|uniref:uncharacterized protein LOC106720026 n=1 Tax=Papilio machaon TaxID=76193 RepID=UPI001E665903|nr:uncharacterized protein LOC106720026 [Papilio machaon]
MPVFSVCHKCIIITLLLLWFTNYSIEGIPISNGFSLKFNPISHKEPIKPRSFGALFAKIPQELPSSASNQDLSEAVFGHPANLADGCTNQVAKMVYPKSVTNKYINETQTPETVNFINLPIISQHAESYNVLVATAPKNIRIGQRRDALPTVLYVVFPGDGESNETSNMNLPAIYFVNKDDDKSDVTKIEKLEPIFIIDSNRTVTGLKSKEVSKFVRFKNKLRNLYDNTTPHN